MIISIPLSLSLSLSLSYETKKINDVCVVNPPKSEIKDKKDIEISFLPMEDCEVYSLYVEPTKTKKIKEVRKGYTYFQENDLLIAKITPCFENGKMSIAKNLVNGIGFGSTEFIVLRTKGEVLIDWVYYCLRNSDFLEEGKKNMTSGAGQQRIRTDFVNDYDIKLPLLEEQKKIIPKLEQKEKDKKFFFDFIDRQKKEKNEYLNNIW